MSPLTPKKRDASAGTVNRELGVLSAALRWANAEGIIDRVIVIKRLPEPEPRKMWLDKECLRFLEASKKVPACLSFCRYRPAHRAAQGGDPVSSVASSDLEGRGDRLQGQARP